MNIIQMNGEVATKASLSSLPPVPAIASLDWAPPAELDRVTIDVSPERLLIWANSDNSGMEQFVYDLPQAFDPSSGIGNLVNYWDGQPAPAYTLTHRQFWRLVDGSYTQLPEGNSQSITYSQTTGISETDSKSLSAEMGVSGDGLSAKISATFSHSITTSSEQTSSHTLAVAAPDKGQVRVWMAWQLCDEIVALMPDGSTLPVGDRGDANRKADVKWAPIPLGGISGAWMYYKTAQTAFPSNTVIYAQHDFPAPGS